MKGAEIMQLEKNEDITQSEQGVIQYEEEDPKMVRMKEAISKYQMKITFIKNKNIDLK